MTNKSLMSFELSPDIESKAHSDIPVLSLLN